MVSDIVFNKNGTMEVIIEVKSGEARLSNAQVKALAAAARNGQVSFTKGGPTLASKGVLPEVLVIGGNSEAIRRQLLREGINVVPDSVGKHRALRLLRPS